MLLPGLVPRWQCAQMTFNSLPFLRYIFFRFLAGPVETIPLEISGAGGIAVGFGSGAGTYKLGRLTCRPDLVCVAIGAISDSSELESSALMFSSSLSAAHLRL